jgi:hypothetical protein
MGMGSGIGYKENSLIISGMEIPIEFGFEEKKSPPETRNGDRDEKKFPRQRRVLGAIPRCHT